MRNLDDLMTGKVNLELANMLTTVHIGFIILTVMRDEVVFDIASGGKVEWLKEKVKELRKKMGRAHENFVGEMEGNKAEGIGRLYEWMKKY